jgi:hypothetical protein
MAKIIKETVVAFRLTAEEAQEVDKALDSDKIIGVRSKGTLARKLVLDHARGKLKWTSKRDKLLAPEVSAVPKSAA